MHLENKKCFHIIVTKKHKIYMEKSTAVDLSFSSWVSFAGDTFVVAPVFVEVLIFISKFQFFCFN